MALSNPSPKARKACSIAEASSVGDVRGAVRPASAIKRARRLTPEDLVGLVADYRSGQTVYQLADKYGIHRHTVSQHLRTAGVRMRLDGMTPTQIDQAVQLYGSGLSLARIAELFGVTAKTVHSRLRERGVQFRDTHGRPR